MARIRTVKPEHWSDKDLPNISMQAHLFWIGTWNFSDDEGVFENDPQLLKSQIFPRRKKVKVEHIISWIEELLREKYIISFQFSGVSYLKSRTFKHHQKIDRKTPSKIPAEIILKLDEHSTSTQRTLSPVEESRGEESSVLVVESRVAFPYINLELSDLDVGKAIEYLTLTKHVDATREMVLSMWEMFKTKNCGKKSYSGESDVRSHFFNSLKYENPNNNGKVNKGNNGGKPILTGQIAKGGFGEL